MRACWGRRRTAAAAAVVGLLSLSACTGVGQVAGSGDAASPVDSTTAATDTPDASSSAPAGPTPYLPVPDGVVLTDPGSELGVGETGVVAWRQRDGEVGVLRVTVRRLERADVKALRDWQLSPSERASALYYVTVRAKNAGSGSLGGTRLPLYVLDGGHTLVESTSFGARFAPCPSPALPKDFAPGRSTTVCLVYLVPERGGLDAVAFRPTDDFNPVTWVGKVRQWKPPSKGNGGR